MPLDHPDGTLPAALIMADIMMPVDIQAQVADLAVDIAAQSIGNLAVDIKAQTLSKLNVNLAASAITLNVNIASQSVSLNVKTTGAEKVSIDVAAQSIGNINVNLAASAITLAVSISGTANISIVAQSVGVYTQAEWSAKTAINKVFRAYEEDVVSGDSVGLSYVVPSGKTLYITQVTSAMSAMASANADQHQIVYTQLYHSTNYYLDQGGQGGTGITLPVPIVFTEGQTMRLFARNRSNHTCVVAVSAAGYEI